MMTEKLLDMMIYGVMRRGAITGCDWIWEMERALSAFAAIGNSHRQEYRRNE